MRIVYTNHARARMEMRKIQEEQVAMTLANPDKKSDYLDDKLVAERKMGSRALRVIYAETRGKYVIISAMWG